MHSLAKKFMMARKLNFGEDGNAQLLDDRVFLMDGDMLRSINEFSGTDGAYKIGERTGRNLAENIQRTGISGTKMSEFMMDLLTMMGFGQFKMHEFNLSSKEGEVRADNCIIARENGDDSECSVMAGVLSGIFSQNYDGEFTVEESACIAQGNDFCRFKIQPS